MRNVNCILINFIYKTLNVSITALGADDEAEDANMFLRSLFNIYQSSELFCFNIATKPFLADKYEIIQQDLLINVYIFSLSVKLLPVDDGAEDADRGDGEGQHVEKVGEQEGGRAVQSVPALPVIQVT